MAPLSAWAAEASEAPAKAVSAASQARMANDVFMMRWSPEVCEKAARSRALSRAAASLADAPDRQSVFERSADAREAASALYRGQTSDYAGAQPPCKKP